MRKCASCGRENPDDRDFCECGEYLRWEPTGYVQAVTPEMARQAVEVTQAPVPPAPPGNGHDKTVTASITLRLPDQDAVPGERPAVGVEPGVGAQLLALVRNQSGIVDNYELRVDGLPEGWWTIEPATVYLVPFGSQGTYEQEVEVRLHPPRTPEAEARVWEPSVVARSKANGRDAAAAPLAVAILPYTETATHVRPERVKGRRRADFAVEVENRANAPVLVALEGSDPDGELRFAFDRPPAELAPGQTVRTTMRVRPPKQIWLGRGVDRPFEITTLTGEEAAGRLAAAPPGRRRAFAPQVQPPGVSVGPGGVKFRAPPAPKLELKLGGGAPAAAAPAGPLLPSQGVLRQRPWLPWWLVPAGIALAAVLALLFLLMPSNVTVPDVVGAASAFEAEQQLTEAGLKAAPQSEEEVSDEAEPGTVIGQTPAAGETAEKDSEVTLLVAVGSGDVEVPDITGKTPAEAEQALRAEKLTLGQASPQPVDPAGKISSQIPAAGETVKEGTPVDVFFPEAGDGGGGGGGGGGDDEVELPASGGATAEAYAATLSEAGLVPKTERAFNDAPVDTVFATEPEEGAKVKAGATVTLFVSAGLPQVAYDNDRDILRVDGAGKKLDPVADGDAREKDPAFSPDGARIAYVSGDRVLLAELDKLDKRPKTLFTGGEYADLAWAPRGEVLALGQVDGSDRELCLVEIGSDPGCLDEPDIAIGGAIHWAPNGKTILAGGVSTSGAFGVVRWRSSKAFSPDPGDWRGGSIVAENVKEAAISPDGKRLAAIALRGDAFQLVLGEPDDVALENAKPTNVRACKLAWLGPTELVVVQADEACSESVGALVRLPVSDPRKQTQLRANGDNPVAQPEG